MSCRPRTALSLTSPLLKLAERCSFLSARLGRGPAPTRAALTLPPVSVSCVLLQVFTYKQNALTWQKVQPMRLSGGGVEDMAALEELHDGAIMHNLFLRYQQGHIYVSVLDRRHQTGSDGGGKQEAAVSHAESSPGSPLFKAQVDVYRTQSYISC